MAKQETLTIFPEIADITQDLTDEQFGVLMRAVVAYRFSGLEYSGDDSLVKFAFRYMANQVDRGESAKQAKSKAARDRWTKQTDAEECELMQSDTEACTAMQGDTPIQSNPIQSNPIQSNNENGGDKPPVPAKQSKKSYGAFGWVKLTEDEYIRLLNDLGESEVKRCIAYVDESAQATGNKNKWRDWNLVIRKCSRDGWGQKGKPIARSGPRQLDADELAAISKMMDGTG